MSSNFADGFYAGQLFTRKLLRTAFSIPGWLMDHCISLFWMPHSEAYWGDYGISYADGVRVGLMSGLFLGWFGEVAGYVLGIPLGLFNGLCGFTSKFTDRKPGPVDDGSDPAVDLYPHNDPTEDNVTFEPLGYNGMRILICPEGHAFNDDPNGIHHWMQKEEQRVHQYEVSLDQDPVMTKKLTQEERAKKLSTQCPFFHPMKASELKPVTEQRDFKL